MSHVSSHTPLFDVEKTHGTIDYATPQPEPPPVYGDALVLEYDTLMTGTSPRQVGFTLGGTVNVLVDWGDGSTNTYTTTGLKSHTYAVDGVYRVVITGTLTTFNNTSTTAAFMTRLVRCLKFLSTLTNLQGAFFGAGFLYEVPATLPTGVTNIQSMFRNCASINDARIASWDVSNVTGAGFIEIFRGASVFDQPLNGWDVSGATNLTGFFQDAVHFDHPLDNWDVSAVTDFSTMFGGADAFNQDIEDWDVSNATTLSQMFFSANKFNGPLDGWDVSGVTQFFQMFTGAADFNQPLGTWDVSAGANSAAFTNMFNGASDFNQNIREWCNPNVFTPPSGFSTGTPGGWTANEKPSWGVCTTRLDMFNYIIDVGVLALNDADDMLYGVGATFYSPLTERGTFTVYDVSDPDNPTQRGSIVDVSFYLATGIVADGTTCYIITAWPVEEELIVVDASDPDNPTIIATVEFGGNGFRSIAKEGDYLYIGTGNVTSGTTNFRIIDVSDPTNPTQVASAALASAGVTFDVNVIVPGGDGYAYVGSSQNLYVVDVSPPTSTPTVAAAIAATGGSLVAGGDVYGMVKDGNYVWAVRNNDGGIVVIDVTTPTSPTHVYRNYVGGIGTVPGGGALGRASMIQFGSHIAIDGDGRVCFITTTTPSAPTLYHTDRNESFFNNPRSMASNGVDYWVSNAWAIGGSSVGAVLNRLPWPP